MSTVSSCLCKDVEELTASFQPRGEQVGAVGARILPRALGLLQRRPLFLRRPGARRVGQGMPLARRKTVILPL